MKIKNYPLAVAFAAGGALALLLLLRVLALISWWLIFIILIITFVPIADIAIKFYEEEGCLDLENFWESLKERFIKNKEEDKYIH